MAGGCRLRPQKELVFPLVSQGKTLCQSMATRKEDVHPRDKVRSTHMKPPGVHSLTYLQIMDSCPLYVSSTCRAFLPSFLVPQIPISLCRKPTIRFDFLALWNLEVNLLFPSHLYPSYSYSLSLNGTAALSSNSHDKRAHDGSF